MTKTNGWPQSNGIRPTRLSCLPIPEEAATYPAPKMAIVAVANPPKYPELATLYSHLWAGFANGITVPETYVRIFSILGCIIAHDYYRNMALGYITGVSRQRTPTTSTGTPSTGSSSPWQYIDAKYHSSLGSGIKFSADHQMLQRMTGRKSVASHDTPHPARPYLA